MVMFMAARLVRPGHPRFLISDRSRDLLRHARRYPGHRPGFLTRVRAWRNTDEFGEAGAEGAQGRTADRETDLGEAEAATTQQRHRALDAPSHQVAVRRFAVRDPELAAEMAGRHVRVAGEGLDVERLGVLPVDAVASPAQEGKVAQVLGRGRFAAHQPDG